MTDSIYIQLSDPWRQGVTITPKIARQIVAMGQPTNLEPVAPMPFANYPIKGWTDKPAAPAGESATVSFINKAITEHQLASPAEHCLFLNAEQRRKMNPAPSDDEATIDAVVAAYNKRANELEVFWCDMECMQSVLAALRRGEVLGLPSPDGHAALKTEVERLRAELSDSQDRFAHESGLVRVAIARADAAERKLRDAYTQIREDPIDTDKVIEDLSNAVYREHADHAEAMVKINNFESLCANESFVKIDRQYRTPGLMEFMVTTCSNQTHDNAKAYGTTPMGAIAAHIAKYQNKVRQQMSRCPECGCKECCGASMHEDAARILAQRDRLAELLTLSNARLREYLHEITWREYDPTPDHQCVTELIALNDEALAELDKEKQS